MATPTLDKTQLRNGMPLTEEQLMRLPAGTGERYELVNGKLRITPPAGHEQGQVASRIGRLIGNWTDEHYAGVTYAAETGFRLAPGTVRGPNAAFVVASRLPVETDPTKSEPFPGAPDLAVEVLTPASSYGDISERIEDFLTHGTRLVWLLIPSNQRVEVHRPDGTVQRLGNDDTLSGEDLMPGFEVPVKSLWPSHSEKQSQATKLSEPRQIDGVWTLEEGGKRVFEGQEMSEVEFHELPWEASKRLELVSGRLRIRRTGSALHDRVVANSIFRVCDAIDDHALLLLNIGFSLVGNHLLRGDGSWTLPVHFSRAPLGDTTRFGSPDFVIEVRQPFDDFNESVAEMREKVHLWLEHGAHEVWLIDPAERTVEVHAPDSTSPNVFGTLDAVKPHAIPGVATDIPVSTLFD